MRGRRRHLGRLFPTGFYAVALAVTSALADRKGEDQVLQSHTKMLIEYLVIT